MIEAKVGLRLVEGAVGSLHGQLRLHLEKTESLVLIDHFHLNQIFRRSHVDCLLKELVHIVTSVGLHMQQTLRLLLHYVLNVLQIVLLLLID